ncbi:hypothetical protein C8F04DRAFT_971230 [Mycena alexandri]|uniref:F-box domain-containing protein n=1 Tax=Mycena alexandri TaxID=1745969 RepID=A0AAD6S7T8_9AGAR|nr:hypothetical protein C8F04DRAFT_971230 [Mycena alexandri]
MASPFASQLGTNYSPNDEEVPKIEALLVEPALRLKRLEDEIGELQKALDKLAAERESLVAYVEGHKSLLSPVRRLPLDIIQEIFLACIPTHRNCAMSASEAPVLLGRICSSWRSISLSTPRLWAKLHFVEPPRSYGPYASIFHTTRTTQHLEGAKSWLGRSGLCPLSISLRTPHTSHAPVSNSSLQEFLQTLIPFASRWQHIDFSMPLATFDVVSQLTETDVPLLESVAFYPFSSSETGWNRFRVLHGLRVSSIYAIGDDLTAEDFPIRWEQLTVLEMAGATWRTSMTSEIVLRILRKTPKLQSCKVMLNDGHPSSGPGILSSHPPVECKFLRTLQFSCENAAATFTQLLDRISLPEMRSFILRWEIDSHGGRCPSLAHQFKRWTQLESLDIDSESTPTPDLLEGLCSLPPTMRRLVIHDVGLPVQVPLDASDSLPGLDVCPLLETLEIYRCVNISDAALLRFIAARMGVAPRATLRRVHIKFNRYMTFDILPSLQPFIEAGLDVSISHTELLPMRFTPWLGMSDT